MVNKRAKVIIVILLSITILFEILQPAHATTLTEIADYTPHRNSAGAATAANGKIYAFGGYASSSCAEILEFDPISETVTNVGTFSEPKRQTAAVTANNGMIYVFSSGIDGNRQNITVFDPNTKSIQELGNFYPAISYRPSVALAPNGMIYVFGCENEEPGNIYKFNPNNNSFAIIGSLPTQLFNSAVVTGADGMIYIFGGTIKNTSTYVSDIIRFDPSTNNAVKVSDLPYPSTLSCAALKPDTGKIYVFGGNASGSGIATTSEYNIIEFDPTTNIASYIGSSPISVVNSSTAVANGENGDIYVIGPGNGSYSTFVLKLCLGLSPTQLSIVLQNNKDAVLTYTPVIEATSYIIERSTDGVNFSPIAEVTETTYTDPDLSPGTYYYRVKAKNSTDISMPSNVVSLTVEQLESPVLTVNLEDNIAYLTWTAVEGATNYILEKSLDGTNFNELTQTTGTSYADPGLSPGTYYYRVKCVFSNGTSMSNVVTVTVEESQPQRFWVYWPEGGQYVKVDWQRGNVDLSGNMVQLWREDTIAGIWIPVREIAENEKDAFEWVDKNVIASLNYKYQVRVYNPSTWEWRVAAESDWAVLDRPFPAPGGLRVLSATDTTATVTWTAVSGASTYQVQFSTDGGANWQDTTVGDPPVTVPKPSMVKVKAGTHARSQWSGVLRVQ